jgi:hypothetical protein
VYNPSAINGCAQLREESYDTNLITGALLWADMRKLSQLICSGHSRVEIRLLVVEGNLLQRDRTKTSLNIFSYLSRRLFISPLCLLRLIAGGDSIISRQASLLAAMLASRFLREFFGHVVCDRLESFNPSLPALFWEDYWSTCIANDPLLNSVRQKTVKEIRSTLLKFLVEVDVLESQKNRDLRAVRFHPEVTALLDSSELMWLKPYVRSFVR